MAYKTPGVYIEEIPTLPPSVAQVETAIPAFIGYTVFDKQEGKANGKDLVNNPIRLKSYTEFEQIFGKAVTTFTITVNAQDELQPIADPGLTFRMNYALQLYFANGGGPCYVCSTGKTIPADAPTMQANFEAGLSAIGKEDEPTMLLFPDAAGMDTEANFYNVYKSALGQCALLGDRVALIDVFNTGAQKFDAVAASFRTGIGNNSLKYGAAYYPWLKTSLNYVIDEETQAVTGGTIPANMTMKKADPADEATSLFHQQKFNKLYHDIKRELSKFYVVMPPTPAIAGVYARVDSTRGVWKAPANVSLNYVMEPMVRIDDEEQRDMNVPDNGKSVNAIRTFTGKGIMLWGARTLAGNDNEWRYVNVRRFFNMVEESVKKATFAFVFEPNDANTWVRVRAMIENFLVLQWRDGALQGAKPDDAFYVRVGLGTTMTALDILEGRMNVEIGMAVVRPAEFIILKFSHKMQES